MKFIKATCPGCGASLELADHLESVICPNCNSQILVPKQQRPAPPKPPTLPDNLKLARAYLEAGNFADAGKQISVALKKNPEDEAAWLLNFKLAKEYIYADKFAEADARVSMALEKNPEDKELWVLKWLCESRRKYDSHSPSVYATKYFENSGYSKSDIPRIYMRYLGGGQIANLIDWKNGGDFDRQLWEAAQRAERAPRGSSGLVKIARMHLYTHFGQYIKRHEDSHNYDLSNSNRERARRQRIEPFHKTFVFEFLSPPLLQVSVEIRILGFDWIGRLTTQKNVSMSLSEWLKFVVDYDRKYGLRG